MKVQLDYPEWAQAADGGSPIRGDLQRDFDTDPEVEEIAPLRVFLAGLAVMLIGAAAILGLGFALASYTETAPRMATAPELGPDVPVNP